MAEPPGGGPGERRAVRTVGCNEKARPQLPHRASVAERTTSHLGHVTRSGSPQTSQRVTRGSKISPLRGQNGSPVGNRYAPEASRGARRLGSVYSNLTRGF